jgi:hypothetical protein
VRLPGIPTGTEPARLASSPCDGLCNLSGKLVGSGACGGFGKCVESRTSRLPDMGLSCELRAPNWFSVPAEGLTIGQLFGLKEGGSVVQLRGHGNNNEDEPAGAPAPLPVPGPARPVDVGVSHVAPTTPKAYGHPAWCGPHPIRGATTLVEIAGDFVNYVNGDARVRGSPVIDPVEG